jgi:hypothetical protein
MSKRKPNWTDREKCCIVGGVREKELFERFRCNETSVFVLPHILSHFFCISLTSLFTEFPAIIIFALSCLPYVEWDRFVTLAGSKSGLRVTLSYLVLVHTDHSLRCLPTFEYESIAWF